MTGSRPIPEEAEQHEKELIEGKARRMARKAGLAVRKSRQRNLTFDNQGKLMVIDPYHNIVVAGSHFDLSPEDVIHFCEEITESAEGFKPQQ